MSIRKNIEDIMGTIRAGDTDLADAIQQEAVLAIKAGEGSKEWENYMNRFAQTPDELARLLPTDSTAGLFEMDLARTTLIGNGTCGATTTGFHLLDGVGDTLDQNL